MIHPRNWFRRVMAKMKTGVGSNDRANDEIREIEVKLDFTPNALASILYNQGNTQVLVLSLIHI